MQLVVLTQLLKFKTVNTLKGAYLLRILVESPASVAPGSSSLSCAMLVLVLIRVGQFGLCKENWSTWTGLELEMSEHEDKINKTLTDSVSRTGIRARLGRPADCIRLARSDLARARAYTFG